MFYHCNRYYINSERFYQKSYSTMYFLNLFERLLVSFACLRKGYNQSGELVKPLNPHFNLINWTIRLTTIVNLYRFVHLIFSTDSKLNIYLGDPLYKSQDRQLLYSTVIFAMANMFFARELFLFLESKGYLAILNELNSLKLNSKYFDYQMTPLKISTFTLAIHLICLTICTSMLLSIIFVLILFNVPLIMNLMSFSIPSLVIYASLWSISLSFSAIFLINAIFSLGGFIIICGTYYFFKLKSLCETIDSIITQHYQMVIPRIDQLQVKSFLINVTLYCNKIDLHIKTLRYVVLYFFLLGAFQCNFYIFVGSIAKNKNQTVNNLLSGYGILAMLLIALLSYIASDFVEMINYIACKFNHITVNFNGLSISTKLKIIEFLDRSKSSYIGIKAGDFIILNKINFILFLLENASTLLLLTVNLRPLLH